MQFGRAVAWIGVTSVLFSVIGAMVGFLLGKFMPGYYRSVFDSYSNPDFDPLAAGFGLGLTQGMALGAVIGLVLVLSYWWKEAKLVALAMKLGSDEPLSQVQSPPVANAQSEEMSIRQ